jgi:hypothetical protein
MMLIPPLGIPAVTGHAQGGVLRFHKVGRASHLDTVTHARVPGLFRINSRVFHPLLKFSYVVAHKAL